MTRRSRRLVPAFIGLVSAGWTIPACYGIASYFERTAQLDAAASRR